MDGDYVVEGGLHSIDALPLQSSRRVDPRVER